MAWTELTVEDLKPRLLGQELTILQSRGLGEFQGDPVPEVISQVVDEVRGYIAANAKNSLGPAGTLPPQLKQAAVSLAIWALAGRPGAAGKIVRSDDRKEQKNDAIALLKAVARDEFKVEQPTELGTEVISDTKPSAYGGDCKLDF